MNDSRDFDLDQMMEQLRLKVRDSRRLTQPAPAAENGQALPDEQLRGDLAQLHQAYDLSRVSLNPNRRVLGRTMLTAARAVSALLAPIIQRQSEYNAANTRLTTHLQKEVGWLRPQLTDLRAFTELGLTGSLEAFRGQLQALARRFAAAYGDNIAAHAQALTDLSRRVAGLEQRQADWDQQSQRLEEQSQRIQEQEQRSQEQLQKLGQQDAHLQDQERRLRDQSKWLEDQERRLREQRRELAERDERIELLGAQYSELAATMAQARSRYEEFRLAREQFLRAQRRLRRLLNAEVGNGAPASDQTLPPPSEPSADFDYAGFEDRLRDSRMIKDKQRGYVEYFAGQAPVIDLGCGRGEFLELMHEAGIQAQGVDFDLDMILLCKEKGLDVVRADAIDYLSGLPDNSLGGIFSAQVIEHLTTAQLSKLMPAAARKLKPGGTLVLETLNPESLLVHFKWFWMDPSHQRLVHPQTLQFMVESAGFAEVCCRFASPPDGVIPIPPLQTGEAASLEEFNRATDRLNKLIYGEQEYYVVARK